MDDRRVFEAGKAIYTPPESVQIAIEQIKKIRLNKDRVVALPMASLGAYFAPMMSGQICSVIAQTSHYKSGFLHYWEFLLATQLQEQERNDEIIVHISVEETVEEEIFLAFARETGDEVGKIARGEIQDWSKLEAAALHIGTIPIYRIGNSIARAEEIQNLYFTNLMLAVAHLKKNLLSWHPKVAAVFIDYLQALPIDPEIRHANQDNQRRLQIRSDIFRLREAAAMFDCPIIIAVQAKQKLDGAGGPNWQMPGQYDGEESSSIGQRSDRIICLWMPKQTHLVGSKISYKGVSLLVEENVLFIKVAKQRGGLPSGKTWKCRVDFGKNIIAPETEEREFAQQTLGADLPF